MKCVICKNGETQRGVSTITLERNGMTFVVKDVPSRVCDNCGEAYLDDETTERLLNLAEEAARSGVQVDIRRYIADAVSGH